MNVFHIIGPIMIGPSSSHTGGAVRIGRIARSLLPDTPKKADIYLHGSFAQTYKGHGTDKALAAGILGMLPDDGGIRTSLEQCKEEGIEINFSTIALNDVHPNTVVIHLTDVNNNTVSVQGSSIGGGNIVITEVNSLKVSITGQSATLIVLHKDKPGTIAAVTNSVASEKLNIANFMLSREKKGGDAVMTIEIDGKITDKLREKILSVENVLTCTMISPV